MANTSLIALQINNINQSEIISTLSSSRIITDNLHLFLSIFYIPIFGCVDCECGDCLCESVHLDLHRGLFLGLCGLRKIRIYQSS